MYLQIGKVIKKTKEVSLSFAIFVKENRLAIKVEIHKLHKWRINKYIKISKWINKQSK